MAVVILPAVSSGEGETTEDTESTEKRRALELCALRVLRGESALQRPIHLISRVGEKIFWQMLAFSGQGAMISAALEIKGTGVEAIRAVLFVTGDRAAMIGSVFAAIAAPWRASTERWRTSTERWRATKAVLFTFTACKCATKAVFLTFTARKYATTVRKYAT